MALIDRVKERFSPQVDDVELQHLIDEATSEIDLRYGTVATEPITVTFAGGSSSLFPAHPIDISEDVEIVEIDVLDAETTLDPTDFRLWNNGRRIERLSTGPNGASRWSELVEITYMPEGNARQRDEVAIKLVKLSLDYEGVTRDSIDGYSATYSDFTRERERLLSSLATSTVRLA
jgi:hypothetical protein